jgi:phenylpropionate dioxygenase-like ring-hydroxylating dioxygenase large terminal subunit
VTIEALIAAHAPAHALDQAFYVDDAVFARDLDLLLGRWSCVGHVSEIPGAGDYFVATLGLESAIVVRGADGEVRALDNVCRHRGSRLCVESRGNAAMLTCPYHAWTYHLDGRLRAAREMPPGFDPAGFDLKSLPVAVIAGLILISFGDAPPSLDAVDAALGALDRRYGWGSAKIAARKTYAVAANWKLVMENYHECYHCAVAHPEFSLRHMLARPRNRDNRSDEDLEVWSAAPDGREVARLIYSPLSEGGQTGSDDGRLLAPLMDARGSKEGDCVFAEAGFLSAFLAYADHGVIYRFIPCATLATQMEVIWLVRGDAREGNDYDVARLTWLWDVTSVADKRIIEMNQAGVRSRSYRPGPYSLMEPATRAYTDRYLGELARV